MQDVLFEVALRSKIRTIINIFCTLPNLNTVYFWKLKCEKDYPGKHYLECWTGPENYLMGNKSFCFNLYLEHGNLHHVDKYVYEYTPILKTIKYHIGTEDEKLILMQLSHLKQHILITDNGAVYDIECYDRINN